MGDDGNTSGKRRNGLSIFLGIVGAVLGFVGALVLAPYNRMDPIASGMIALFVFGPMGAVAGAFAGAWLGNRGREKVAMDEAIRDVRAGSAPIAASTAPPVETIDHGKNFHKVANALFVLVTIAGAIGAFMYLNQKPPEDFSLNPGGPNPVLQFEVRLPAGAPMPSEKDIRASMHERPHSTAWVWAKWKPDVFRQDGDRPVIAGEALLGFRTADRQIQMEIAGSKFDEVFYLTLPATPPHTAELGAWVPRGGSEIRYRVKWPGKE